MLGTVDRRIINAIRRPPPFRMVHHPRRFSKPLRCKAGKHPKFITKIVNGWPQLVCAKCGSAIFEPIKNNTVTRKEARDKMFPKEAPRRTKREVILDAYERLQQDQKQGIRRKY